MSSFIQLIQNCLSPDNILRTNAEKEILQYSDQNLFQVLTQLCNLIVENSTPGNICLFCGTFIKHIFSNDKYISIWNTFSSEQITFIKTNLLGNLASEKNEIKKTCSLAIAAMAKVEIPKGWNIVEIICKTAIHENINYKITSLITIQNLLDFIGNKLKPHEKQQILCSLTTDMSINEHVDVISEAVKGYMKIVPFIEDNFKNEKERIFMINLLLNIIEPNYINKVSLNEKIQENILICFSDIIKYYALYLQNNFLDIANMSFRYFNHCNKSLSNFAVEMWSTVCEAEEQLKNNIISSNYQDNLNDSILRLIQTRDYNSAKDEDEWTPAKGVVILLSCLSSLGNKKIIQRMINFISECLNNELVIKFDKNYNQLNDNEKMEALFIKENAYLIYRGILFSKDIDQEIIEVSLFRLFNELKNTYNLPIDNSIAKCLIVICKVHFNIFNETQKKFDSFIVEIIKILEFHINNKKILNNLLTSVKHILRNSKPKYFNKHLTDILTILMKIAYDKKSYNKDLNVSHISMFFMGKIIEICEDNEKNINNIKIFFSDLYSRFQNSLNPKNFTDKEEQISFQNDMLGLIVSCGGYNPKIIMDTTQFTCVYNLIEQCIQQRGYLFNEAILVLGSLAYFGWDLFSNINNSVMKYVLYALEERNDFQLCYQTLLAVDDIIRNVGKNIVSNIPNIVSKIKNIIKDPNIPRGLKIKCFAIFSDIFMIGDKSNLGYIDDVIQLLIEGIKTSIKKPDKDMDEEELEYLNELREKIVELLTSFFAFLADYKQTNAISQYIDGIIIYLNKIADHEYNCKLGLIAEICGLLGDLYKYYQGSIELYLEPNTLQLIYNKLQESPDPEHKEILKYCNDMMEDLISNSII